MAVAQENDPAAEHARRAVEAVWRDESARIVAALTRQTGDFAWAEDLAQEALVEALATWPGSGIPGNPGAWLMAVAKRQPSMAGVAESGLLNVSHSSRWTSETPRSVILSPGWVTLTASTTMCCGSCSSRVTLSFRRRPGSRSLSEPWPASLPNRSRAYS
nr:sigma factor [Microbacterium allomyrinae]